MPQWILGRQHYHIARFDLRNVPRASRDQALRLQLDPWSPYSDMGYTTLWQSGWATVFCWDAQAIQQQMIACGLKPSRVRMIPETTLRPPADHEIRLLQGLFGYEGQIWSNNQLTHSRHWPQMPEPSSWLLFQRDAGVSAERQIITPPTPQSLPWMDRPWRSQGQALNAIGEGWRNEKWLYSLLALISLTLFSAAASQLYHLTAFNQQLERQAESAQEAAAPLAQARSQALQALQTLQLIAQLDPYPSQLEVMAWLAENLLKKNDRIIEWEYQKEGQLKITLELAEDTKVTALVEKLHKAGLFSEARSTPANKPNRVTLEMKLKPVQAPPESPDAA